MPARRATIVSSPFEHLARRIKHTKRTATSGKGSHGDGTKRPSVMTIALRRIKFVTPGVIAPVCTSSGLFSFVLGRQTPTLARCFEQPLRVNLSITTGNPHHWVLPT